MALTALSDILANRQLSGETVTFEATQDWAQGRTLFGGFLSALALVAMRDTLAIDLPLRALQTNFVGPVVPGAVVCHARLLRQGKSVMQVQCEMWSEGVLAALVVGVFGASRVSGLPVTLPVFEPLSVQSQDLPDLPFIEGVTPDFVRHVQMRWAQGAIPYTGQPSLQSSLYLRTPDTGLSPEVMVVILSDGPPTPVLSHFTGPVMASSVSWSLELPTLPLQTTGLEQGWFRIDLQAHAVSEGYVNQSARLWTPQGQLASLGYQVVAVYG